MAGKQDYTYSEFYVGISQQNGHQSFSKLYRRAKNREIREGEFGILDDHESHFNGENYMLKELHVKVSDVINALPPVCRLVFVLSRYERFSINQIADHLNISVKTVNKNMIKALTHIRR